MPRPSRSMFASLPYDLKRTLKSQTIQSYPDVQPRREENITLEAKQEYIEGVNGTGLLSTQPASPISGDEDGGDITANQINGTTDDVHSSVLHDMTTGYVDGDTTLLDEPADGTPAAGPSKRPLDAEPAFAQISSAPRKKRHGKSKAPVNAYADHPWDCTGLVPRYTDYSDVPTDLAKYFAQRHLYFPLYDSLPLLLDDIGWYSITPHPIAAHIADRCACDVIIDAFCGVGGNAIEFARTCERVIAIDNDPTRLRLARHNALHIGVADRIEFILGDFTDFARTWKARKKGTQQSESVDVVFLSPPWGGPEYLTFAAPNTPSSAPPTYPLAALLPIPGDELFKLASELSPNIAYFLPRNMDIRELSALAPPLPRPAMDGTSGGKRGREWVEVEEEWVGDKLKAITAYFGGLVAE